MNRFVISRLENLLKKTSISSAMEADFSQNGKVLVISPHYDDDVLSCFGAMKAHADNGNEIHILYVTDGSASLDSGLQAEDLIITRKTETTVAIKKFISKVKFLFMDEKDGKFHASLENLQYVVQLLKKEKYVYIYCPAKIDTHKDHKESYRLLKWAMEKCKHPCTVRFYEFWYPLENPNIYVNLEACDVDKAEAIACHKSQLRYLDYVKISKILNEYRGNQVGVRMAEAFYQVTSEHLMTLNKLRLSVVIPAYNNEKHVGVMLTALSRQKCNFTDWEIVLVDDSEDNRMTQFKDRKIPNLRVIEKKHSGRADTRNVGILESYGDIIVFMDSDMIVDEHFVQAHHDAHINSCCDIVLGKVNHILNEHLEKVQELVDSNRISTLRELVVLDDYLNLSDIVFGNRCAADYIGWICCLFSNCSVKRKVFEKSGLFDLAFVGWGLEDVELGYRFFKENFRFSYIETIQNYHVDHATDANKMIVEMGRNLKQFFKKHPDAEIKSYMSFVAGFKDLQELLNDVAKESIEFSRGRGQYFKPLCYAKSKS